MSRNRRTKLDCFAGPAVVGFVLPAIVGCLLGIPGCGRSQPTRNARNAGSTATKVTDQPAVSSLAPPTRPAAEPEPGADPPPDSSSGSALGATSNNDETSVSATSLQPAPKTARVMLLASSGPLLIDLHITRNNQPIAQAFTQCVDEILNIAGGSANQPVTWKQLLAHPRFRDGQFGNPTTGNYQAQVQAIRQYDTTKNGRVDLGELVRYLTNNRTSRGFTFTTSNDRQLDNRIESWIAGWLDRDDNRTLDDNELAGAAERLRQRDTNEDGLLSRGELSDSPTPANGTMARRRRASYAPKTGWIFPADMNHFPWSDIRIAWENAYGAGQAVRRENLGRGARMFDELDIDRDQSLDSSEMERLTEVAADIVLQIDFGNQSTPQVRLLGSRFSPEHVLALIQHQPNRVTLKVAGLVLDLFGIGSAADASLPQVQAFFDRADQDKDGVLSQKEFQTESSPFAGQSFETFDVNQDQSLSADELEMLAGQRTWIARHHVSIRADGQSDALFSVLDINSDGRLDARETAHATDSLLSLDKNGDERLGFREFNDALLLGVVLGMSNPGQTANTVALDPPPVRRSSTKSTPTWFAGMDRNGDESISWPEFLGTRQQFQQWDRDGDGFVDVNEATSGSSDVRLGDDPVQ